MFCEQKNNMAGSRKQQSAAVIFAVFWKKDKKERQIPIRQVPLY